MDSDSTQSKRLFWRVTATSGLGELSQGVADVSLPIIAVVALGASGWEVSAVTAAETAGLVLFGLLAGAFADRHNRVTIITRANLLRALAFVALPVAWFMHLVSVPVLVALGLVAGACGIFADTAAHALTPSIVPEEDLLSRNSQLQAVDSATQIGAPALAGFIIQTVGSVAAASATSLGYLFAAMPLLGRRAVDQRRVDSVASSPGRGPNLRREVREGFQELWRQRELRSTIACTATFNFAYGMLQPLFYLFFLRDLHVSESGVGLVLAMGGVGSVVSAFFAERVVSKFGIGATIWLPAIVAGCTIASFAALTPRTALVVGGLLQAILAVAVTVYNITVFTLRQSSTSTEILGRVSATSRVIVWGTAPLGSMLAGAALGVVGVRESLVAAGVVACASSLWILFSPIRRVKSMTDLRGER